jgi:hypothetical protein
MSVAKVVNNERISALQTASDCSSPISEAIATEEAAGEDLSRPTDSWESVTQQPFCALCQMTFKSMGFLDRHTKYSDVHAKRLIATQTAGGSPEGCLSPAIATPSVQEEGVHYRLLYHGSKFFWKFQKSIDLTIYSHLLASVLEVVAFDVERHRELQRIYLDGVSVEQNVEAALQEEVDCRKKILSRDRFAVVPSEDVLRDEVRRNLLTTTILQRLQLHSDISDRMFEIGLVFVTNSDDACKQNPCLDRPPSVVVPVVIAARRRKSTASEINNAISNLRTDGEDIAQYLSKANKLLRQPTSRFEERADQIAKIVFDAAAHLRRPKWFSLMSRPRRKWIWAIRRVIRAVYVERMRTILNGAQLKRQFKRTATLRRGPSMRAKEF